MRDDAGMTRYALLIWLVVLSGLAAIWPLAFGDTIGFDPFTASKPYLGWVVIATMFCVGCLLPAAEVREVLRRWPQIVGGTTVQYTAMPLLAWGFATAFQLPTPLRIGVIMVGCVPGAMASNVLTLAARGNVSYSVGLTTSATLLSPIIVPLALKVTLQADASVTLLASAAVQLLQEVVIPVILGFLLCRWHPFAKVATRLAPPIAHAAILWIIAVVVALNRETLASFPGQLLTLLLLLNLSGYLAGSAGARLLRLDAAKQRALVLEVGMQNAGVGASLATRLFADTPGASLPAGLYAFGCMLTGTLLAQWFAMRPIDAPREFSTET